MTETMQVEPWLRLLSRTRGVVWSVRRHPAGKLEWMHVDARRMEALYEVPESELLPDPTAILGRVMAEDRGRLEQVIAHGAETLTTWSWTGRIITRSDETRWIEMHTVIEMDSEGMQIWHSHALDVTDRKRVEQALAARESDLRAREDQLAESEQARAELEERVRSALEELSNPILEVWDGVLAMPIVGIVDTRRTADMVQRLLAEVARTQASFVIIDLTGVEVVDTMTADHLMKLMRKVEIVGAQCVLSGIQPAVAETLIDIGVDFGRVTTLRNLKHGLRAALEAARREREELSEENLADDDEPEEEKPQARKKRSR